MTTPSVSLSEILQELQKLDNHLVDVNDRQNYAAENRSNRNTQFIIDQVTRSHGHTDDIINRTGSATLAAVESTKDSVNTTSAALGIQNERLANELVTLIGSLNQNQSNNLSNFAVSTARDFAQVARDNFQVERELAKVESSLGSKIDNTLAQVQLQAANNKSDVLQKMAECCCEIKQKMCETDNGRLRDILQASEIRSAGLEFGRFVGPGFGPGPWGPPPPPPPGPGPFPRWDNGESTGSDTVSETTSTSENSQPSQTNDSSNSQNHVSDLVVQGEVQGENNRKKNGPVQQEKRYYKEIRSYPGS